MGSTPLQWNSSKYADFSNEEPWLPVNKNYETINIEGETNEPNSILNVYKELIEIRKKYDVLQMGDWKIMEEGKNGILSYLRYTDSHKIKVILNFSSRKKHMKVSLPSQLYFRPIVPR